MTVKNIPHAPRRAVRLSVLVLGLALTMSAPPALAAPPEAWPDTDNGSLLDQLMLLVGVPLAVVVVVTLLTYLPSLVRRGSGESSELAFQDRTEWFGGPRNGVDATSEAGTPSGKGAPESTGSTGGASANW